jgi:hypothetical protein
MLQGTHAKHTHTHTHTHIYIQDMIFALCNTCVCNSLMNIYMKFFIKPYGSW